MFPYYSRDFTWKELDENKEKAPREREALDFWRSLGGSGAAPAVLELIDTRLGLGTHLPGALPVLVVTILATGAFGESACQDEPPMHPSGVSGSGLLRPGLISL